MSAEGALGEKRLHMRSWLPLTPHTPGHADHGPDEECEAPLDFDDVPSLEDVARMEREKGEREKGRGTERL